MTATADPAPAAPPAPQPAVSSGAAVADDELAGLSTRLKKEIRGLRNKPPPGISAWLEQGSKSRMRAQLYGFPADSPFERGVFELEIHIEPASDRQSSAAQHSTAQSSAAQAAVRSLSPSVPRLCGRVSARSYPHRPPSVRFVTPVYHPNVDEQGRICLDSLNLPPKGMWSPLLTLEATLLSVQQLLAQPNGSDGLSKEATDVFNSNRAEWERRARQMTAQHALPAAAAVAASDRAGSQAQEPRSEQKVEGDRGQAKEAGDVAEVSDGKRRRKDEVTGAEGDSGVEDTVDKRAKVG